MTQDQQRALALRASEAARQRKWRDWLAQEAGCEYCNDTGDVHSIDGEWRGICSCSAGEEIRQRDQQATGTPPSSNTGAETP